MNMLSVRRLEAAGPFDLVLAALGIDDGPDFVSPTGLPAVSIHVPARDAIIALTYAGAPFYRDGVEAAAMAYAADVVLLRRYVHEDLPVVRADIALAAPRWAAWVEHDLTLWMKADALWLVPHGFGPSVEIGTAGFSVTLLPPYNTLGERDAGIERAARACASPRHRTATN